MIGRFLLSKGIEPENVWIGLYDETDVSAQPLASFVQMDILSKYQLDTLQWKWSDMSAVTYMNWSKASALEIPKTNICAILASGFGEKELRLHGLGMQ
ncbi:hypothetical protein JD844_029086 [Phrynosoma platyrhinos]|uniref:Uncharacterized protein n=1 Tax=Phrynosoma platyrhinos TaxID=52577 RepID=A0ABQ7SIT4_PHRPL|nr:hypothetical protein JD844_029086 [Phrynosoma platyrhinos]